MRCRQVGQRLGEYVERELSPALEGEVREHLQGCEACRREEAAMRAALRDLIGYREAVEERLEAPELPRSLAEAMKTPPGASPWRPRGRAWQWSLAPAALAAAALLLRVPAPQPAAQRSGPILRPAPAALPAPSGREQVALERTSPGHEQSTQPRTSLEPPRAAPQPGTAPAPAAERPEPPPARTAASPAGGVSTPRTTARQSTSASRTRAQRASRTATRLRKPARHGWPGAGRRPRPEPERDRSPMPVNPPLVAQSPSTALAGRPEAGAEGTLAPETTSPILNVAGTLAAVGEAARGLSGGTVERGVRGLAQAAVPLQDFANERVIGARDSVRRALDQARFAAAAPNGSRERPGLTTPL